MVPGGGFVAGWDAAIEKEQSAAVCLAARNPIIRFGAGRAANSNSLPHLAFLREIPYKIMAAPKPFKCNHFTNHLTSVDSKQLTAKPKSFRINTYKKTGGWGGCVTV